MPSNTSKMLLRAEIFATLNKYSQISKIKVEALKKDIEKLKKIEDKKYLARVLIDEILTGTKEYAKCCAVFLLNAADKNYIQNYAFKILEKNTIEDEKKIYLISLLKQKGVYFERSDVENFLNDLETIAQNGVRDFVQDASINPETQIDLLDFYSNISTDERISLLNNLIEEQNNDDIINVFSLITFLELTESEKNIIKEKLLSSKNPLAITGLENLGKNSDKQTKISKKIKELKFKNPNFEIDFLTKNTRPYKKFVSFIDGFGNFSLVFSRISKNNLLDASFYVINTEKGIISTVGFYQIPSKNFDVILKRLFSDSPCVEIQSEILLSLLNFYSKKNSSTNTTLPYEYNVWINMLNDIQKSEGDILKIIDSKLKRIELKTKNLENISNSKVVETWYFTKNQTKLSDELFKILTKENTKDFELFSKKISEFTDEKLIKNKKFLENFLTKLLLQAYISLLANLKTSAFALYSIIFNKNHVEYLLNFICNKSIYIFLKTYLENKESDNVFLKYEKIDFTQKEILNIMSLIKEKWKLKNV